MTVPLIGVTRHDAERTDSAAAPDEKRRCGLLPRARIGGGALQPVVLTREIDGATRPQRFDHRNALFQAVKPFLERWKRDAVGLVLRLVPSGADPEHEAAEIGRAHV